MTFEVAFTVELWLLFLCCGFGCVLTLVVDFCLLWFLVMLWLFVLWFYLLHCSFLFVCCGFFLHCDICGCVVWHESTIFALLSWLEYLHKNCFAAKPLSLLIHKHSTPLFATLQQDKGGSVTPDPKSSVLGPDMLWEEAVRMLRVRNDELNPARWDETMAWCSTPVTACTADQG